MIDLVEAYHHANAGLKRHAVREFEGKVMRLEILLDECCTISTPFSKRFFIWYLLTVYIISLKKSESIYVPNIGGSAAISYFLTPELILRGSVVAQILWHQFQKFAVLFPCLGSRHFTQSSAEGRCWGTSGMGIQVRYGVKSLQVPSWLLPGPPQNWVHTP